MQIQTKALTRAINLLKACGATYTVVSSGGRKFTNQPSQPRTLVKRKKEKVPGVGKFSDYFRSQGLDRLDVGGVVVVPYVDGVAKERLRANIAGFAHRMWGRESAMTALNGTGVEVMRVL